MEAQSIEDLILSRYIGELSNDYSVTKKVELSPYQQPLRHTNILASHRSIRGANSSRSKRISSVRSQSSERSQRRARSGSRERPSRRNQTAPDRSTQFVAPVEGRNDEDSEVEDERQDSDVEQDEEKEAPRRRRGKKRTPTYMKRPEVFVVTAFKNGDRSGSCRVSAPSYHKLLEACTHKLHLPSSARKLFRKNGRLIEENERLPRGSEVFVSMGEAFKDPVKLLEKKLNMKNDLEWTLNGLNLPNNRTKEFTKPVQSQRFESKASPKRRVLVFLNGKGLNACEIVADMNNIDALLQNCTLKFSCGQHIRRLLRWDGGDVKNLHEESEIHHLLNSAIGTPLLGPFWASKGENISPSGVAEYLKDVMRLVGRRKSRSEEYLEQLRRVRNAEKRETVASSITCKKILSMKDQEIEQEMKKEEDFQKECDDFLSEHESQLEQVQPQAQEEQKKGSKFTMKHIAPMSEKHRLVSNKGAGYGGMRLNVFENGKTSSSSPVAVYFNVREATRGLSSKKESSTEIVFQRFLDSLSSNLHIASHNSKSKGVLVQRVFTKTGEEIRDIKKLHYDDEIWISYGESWMDPFSYCLQVEISKAILLKHESPKGDWQEVIRTDPDLHEGQERPANWRVTDTMPQDIQARVIPAPEKRQLRVNCVNCGRSDSEFEDEEEEEEEPQPHKDAFPERSTFLQNIKDESLCLFVEPVVGIETSPRLMWPRGNRMQEWLVHKTGQISPKGFPRLALCVTGYRVKSKVKSTDFEGNLVQLGEVEPNAHSLPAALRWEFGTDGLIYSAQMPDLALTNLGGFVDERDTWPKNSGDESAVGYRNLLAACPPLEGNKKYQQFGIRQTQFKNFGQWRKMEMKNPKWSKLAILWPVDKNGEWIKELESPVEAQLVAFAPPLKNPPRETDAPKRFFCLKNGERNKDFGVYVTAPDLTNMKKDRKLSKTRGRRESRESLEDEYLHNPHCMDWTVREVERKIFLETSTGLLGLPSAARRIFDEKGHEIQYLDEAERDSLLYVSTGEGWQDPQLSRDQLEARARLVKIAEDVDKIRNFVQLKRTESLVLTVEQLTPGSSVGVSRDAVTKKEKRARQLQEADAPPDVTFSDDDDDDEEADDPLELTAHQRACQRSDERARNKNRWKWQRDDPNDFQPVTEENAAEPVREDRKRVARTSLALKEFVVEDDGFISVKADPSLVLTAAFSDTRVMDVALQKRRLDNPYQKWKASKNGFFALKNQQNSVLTLQLPKVTTFANAPVNIEDSKLTVQPIKLQQFGRANQMFSYDEFRCTIRCFSTNSHDLGVTAANQAGCCTSCVTQLGDRLHQPGYMVYLPFDTKEAGKAGTKYQKCQVCVSCARSLRGRFKLQKLPPTADDFCCELGHGGKGVKETGSFTELRGKVDLSEGEDVATLKKWEAEIEKLRDSLSVHAINSRLSETKTPRPIRVLAYRNGEGRLCQPVPIHASSVQGVLDQCSVKLGLSWAARKLFMEDGTPVLDMEDLREWCVQHAKRLRKRQQQIESGHVQPELEKIRAEAAKADREADDDVDNNDENVPEAPKRAQQAAPDDLEPRLTPKFFVLGSRLESPSVYNLGISLESLSVMEQVVSQRLLADDEPHFVLRYNIFGQTITTDPFSNEETFDGERREIQIKSELRLLRRYFHEKFKLLKIDLLLLPEETVIATSYVPLDSLIRAEHEDLLSSLMFSGDYAWYKKTLENPKGGRTHASLRVEVSLNTALDVEVDESDAEDDSTENLSNTNASHKSETRETATKETDAEQAASEESETLEAEELASFCVELWVSTGEAFVPLHVAHAEFREMVRKRQDLRDVITSREVDKHLLKMLRGRRLQGQEPATFRSTTDPEQPVVVEGGWQTPRGDELMVQREIDDLDRREAKIRERHPPSARSRPAVDFDRLLYRQPALLKVRVFPNGGDPANAVSVWGETVQQILDNATSRLSLRRPAQSLFDMEGCAVRDFGGLEKDQLLCVTVGNEAFLRPSNARENVEIRANWGRAKRQYGTKATNFQIQARAHPQVGVDPFGPPLHSRRQQAREVPTFDNKRILVYENGRSQDDAVSAWGASLEALLESATRQLNLRQRAVCFFDERGQRIVDFGQISRDDRLAVSTSGRSFIRS